MMSRFYRIALTRDFLFGSGALAVFLGAMALAYTVTP